MTEPRCKKVRHEGSGYLHDADDDSPYEVDGVLYCGRCHSWKCLDSWAAPKPKPKARKR